MRYYIYLDKDFLKSLTSVLEDNNFNIQVIEYSLQNNYTTTKDASINPCIENICDSNVESRKSDEKNNEFKKKNGDFSKKNVNISYDNSITCTTTREKRYINIEDISQIKNFNFYHNLIEKLRLNLKDRGSRIVEEYGNIKLLDERSDRPKYGDECSFFNINDTYIWYDKNKISADINFLSNILCKVKVISYNINEENGIKISKAIAVFID